MTLDFQLVNWIFLAAGIAGATFVCVQSWIRSGFKARTGLLELFRFLLVTLACFTLFQPKYTFEVAPVGQSVVQVLVDHSDSMETRDVAESGQLVARSNIVKRVEDKNTWLTLTDDHQVQIDRFASATRESDDLDENGDRESFTGATDIHAALSRVADQPGDVRAVVLASDGDWNSGAAPSNAARKLRQLGIPVYGLTAGSPNELPDLELTGFDLPTFAVVGKPLRIPITVRSTLDVPADIKVNVQLPNDETRAIALQVPAKGSVDSVVEWRPAQVGTFEITVDIPPHPSEEVINNNRRTESIKVRYESLKVLMIDTFPRWEYRYTRNALVRDPGVTVNTLLLHPDMKEHGDGPGYLQEFPTIEELSQYDVIFLGDVGVGPLQLTVDQCEQIYRHVRNQAAGLIFLPGFRGFQSTLLNTRLDEIFPVEVDKERPKGARSREPAYFKLTEAGRSSLLTRLETVEETNAKVWNTLPGFFWHAAVSRAKPNTETLAVHSTKTNRFGRIPLVVTRTFGTGKSLFVGTDSAWRWRKGVEDLYHYRFWSQMVRWMAYQRTMSNGESMRLIYSPDRPKSGQVINLKVNAMSSSGEPLENGTVTTQVISPSGSTETLNLLAGKDTWGLFTSSFVATEGGVFKLITTCAETGSRLETEINVLNVPKEKVGSRSRPEVMQDIAAITQGTSANLTVDNLADVIETLSQMPPRTPEVHQFHLWSHPLWGLSLILLLGIFWTCRKLQGLI